MDWKEITAAKLKTVFSEYEWTAITNAARASSAGDVVDTTIDSIVGQVRGSVESNPANTLGPEGYVPAVLENATLMLCMDALAATLPAAGIMLDEARVRRVTAAQQRLQRVEDGKITISGPGSSQTPPADAPVPDTGDYGGSEGVNFSGIR